MTATRDFRDIQYEFTAYLRDPDSCKPPADVEQRRVNIYRDLLYNNVEGFMANAFPVLRSLTDDARWHTMMRDYFARHQARTGLFPKMPQEFLHYLSNEREATDDPPFLAELAHYEWLEAEVLFDPREIDQCVVDSHADLPAGCPVANPVLRPWAYQFPVHRIAPNVQPSAAPEQPTYLVVFRHRDDSAGFMQLNAVSARLLELILANNGRSAEAILRQIAEEMQYPDASVIIAGGTDILQDFLKRDIIVGTISARS